MRSHIEVQQSQLSEKSGGPDEKEGHSRIFSSPQAQVALGVQEIFVPVKSLIEPGFFSQEALDLWAWVSPCCDLSYYVYCRHLAASLVLSTCCSIPTAVTVNIVSNYCQVSFGDERLNNPYLRTTALIYH